MSLAHLRVSGNAADGRAIYEKLAREHPSRPEPVEALAYLAWRQRDSDTAVSWMGRAAELGSTNSKLYWDYAGLLHGRRGEEKRFVAALEKLLAIDPGHVEARLSLSDRLTRDHKHREALNVLLPVKNVTREQAPAFFRMLAYLRWQVGDREEAVTAARRLVEVAPAGEKEDAEQLLRIVSQKPEDH